MSFVSLVEADGFVPEVPSPAPGPQRPPSVDRVPVDAPPAADDRLLPTGSLALCAWHASPLPAQD